MDLVLICLLLFYFILILVLISIFFIWTWIRSSDIVASFSFTSILCGSIHKRTKWIYIFSKFSASWTYFSMPQLSSNIDININCDIIRERSALSSKASSRNSSVFSSTSSAPYHEYMELNNNLQDIEFPEPINSSQLSYADQVDVGECYGMLCVKITRSRLCLFYFYFYFYLLFIFLFLE